MMQHFIEKEGLLHGKTLRHHRGKFSMESVLLKFDIFVYAKELVGGFLR